MNQRSKIVFFMQFLPPACRAGDDGVLRAYAGQYGDFFCHLRAAQDRMARRVSQRKKALELQSFARRAGEAGA
ncbi:hypothetical protein A2U01_0087505, partial [Trifolium medium]|nr:hypothetical protein [Trifolium medium]